MIAVGAIGVEFANVMKNLALMLPSWSSSTGWSHPEDADISRSWPVHYKELGARAAEHQVEGVEDTVLVRHLVAAGGGDQQVLEADKLLSAIGFAPRTDGYARKIGVELTDRGAVAIDEFCRTNVRNVYADR